ncbi:MAG: imidazole glycerol phosphate synthase subunit HisF [Spirochaeta sp. LUC14_002_19_P3]|nr:MAG: imidazole glycerol phosphate synthase subunit HisF [Spirochaeta sp. LUC14_002_19_P3]
MLQKRLIICLDVRDGRTTKGVKFQGNVDIGDPVAMAAEYYAQGVDELVFYDITASAEKRGIMIETVKAVARTVFIPFCVGGGIRSLADMNAVMLAGADKISVNSAAVRQPDIISDGACHYGSQCIVLGMDVKSDPAMPSGYGVVIDGGRVNTGLDMLAWAREAVDRGAGEIVLNSIDADGTQNGYELRATRLLGDAVSVPVVASGGAGVPEHIPQVFQKGRAEAALVASMVHSGRYTVADIKEAMAKAGIGVRGC